MGTGERVVAGWVLEKRLGSGGYGEVWRARRQRVDLVRALKLIPIAEEGAFESWRHETRRLGVLNHPNVVRFYDADIVTDGPYTDYAWIATELCEQSLAETLHAAPDHLLAWPEGERLLAAMLAALAAAHAAGMVHRDLKPANILRHHSGTWKLCDFGTARLVPADGTHPMTRVIGTSPYMSPDAHRGRQNQAADLYALGVTLHEALCRERLHRRPPGMTDSEYIKLVLDTAPAVSAELPRRWQTVVTALIGGHGPLGAAQLDRWFSQTRGDRPPANGTRPGVATGPTAVAAGDLSGPAAASGPGSSAGSNGPAAAAGSGSSAGSNGPAAAAVSSGSAGSAPAAGSGGSAGSLGSAAAAAGSAAAARSGGSAGSVGSAAASSAQPARSARPVRGMAGQPVVVAGPMAPRRPKHRWHQRSVARTGRTEARVAPPHQPGHVPAAAPPASLAPAAPASPPAGRVHIPAPANGASRAPNGGAAPAPPRPPVPGNGQRPGAPPPASAPPAARAPWSPPAADPTAVTGRRTIAALVDGFVVLVLAFGFFLGAVTARYHKVPVPAEASDPADACSILDASFGTCLTIGDDVYVTDGDPVAFQPLVVLAALLVFVGLQGLTGATPGKLLVGLRVVGPDGRPPGIVRAVLRTMLLVVDGFPWFLPLLGWLLVTTTRRHRRLGDMVAGTLVVRRRAIARR